MSISYVMSHHISWGLENINTEAWVYWVQESTFYEPGWSFDNRRQKTLKWFWLPEVVDCSYEEQWQLKICKWCQLSAGGQGAASSLVWFIKIQLLWNRHTNFYNSFLNASDVRFVIEANKWNKFCLFKENYRWLGQCRGLRNCMNLQQLLQHFLSPN